MDGVGRDTTRCRWSLGCRMRRPRSRVVPGALSGHSDRALLSRTGVWSATSDALGPRGVAADRPSVSRCSLGRESESFSRNIRCGCGGEGRNASQRRGGSKGWRWSRPVHVAADRTGDGRSRNSLHGSHPSRASPGARRGFPIRRVSLHGILDPVGIRTRVRTLEDFRADGRGGGVTEIYLWLKWAHVVSSTVLFGMGAGIAFFFIRAQRTGDVRVIAAVGREVVIADAIFTASAVVLQPITGLTMVRLAGFPLSLPWLRWSIAVYVLIGCCWLPVVWLQVRMRNIAARAMLEGTALPTMYSRYYRWWFYLGWPAFTGVLVVFYLMVVKPAM